MQIWPFYMLACAGLSYWGYRAGAAFAPALLLAGLVGMRGVIWGLEPDLHEVAACTLWLCIGFVLMYKGAWVPGFFVTLSGLSYAGLLLVGLRIEYLGLLPIIADLLFWLAFLSIAGGLLASHRHVSAGHSGFLDRVSIATLGMASREARGFVAVESGSKMIYGKH